MSMQHFNAHVRFSAIKSQRKLMLDGSGCSLLQASTLLWTLWLGFFLWAVHQTSTNETVSEAMAVAAAHSVPKLHPSNARIRQLKKNFAHALLLRRRLGIMMLARTASARREHVPITPPPETPTAGKPVALQLTGTAPPGPLPPPAPPPAPRSPTAVETQGPRDTHGPSAAPRHGPPPPPPAVGPLGQKPP